LDASPAIRSKISFTNEFIMDMALRLDRTSVYLVGDSGVWVNLLQDLVDVGGVGLGSLLGSLLALSAWGLLGCGLGRCFSSWLLSGDFLWWHDCWR
jgi:hypothetical protein